MAAAAIQVKSADEFHGKFAIRRAVTLGAFLTFGAFRGHQLAVFIIDVMAFRAVFDAGGRIVFIVSELRQGAHAVRKGAVIHYLHVFLGIHAYADQDKGHQGENPNKRVRDSHGMVSFRGRRADTPQRRSYQACSGFSMTS